MSILRDANKYIELQTWAEEAIEKVGYQGVGIITRGIEKTIQELKAKPSRKPKEEAYLEKLEDMGLALDIVVSKQKMLDFTAPGREAIKKVESTRTERASGGANSHGLDMGERMERNRQLQDEINRLCAGGHTYRNAQRITANALNLHIDTVRKITKNPCK